jgi:hypothetical protein
VADLVGCIDRARHTDWWSFDRFRFLAGQPPAEICGVACQCRALCPLGCASSAIKPREVLLTDARKVGLERRSKLGNTVTGENPLCYPGQFPLWGSHSAPELALPATLQACSSIKSCAGISADQRLRGRAPLACKDDIRVSRRWTGDMNGLTPITGRQSSRHRWSSLALCTEPPSARDTAGACGRLWRLPQGRIGQVGHTRSQ